MHGYQVEKKWVFKVSSFQAEFDTVDWNDEKQAAEAMERAKELMKKAYG